MTTTTQEYKQLVHLLYAANARARELKRSRNQARTALRNDVAKIFVQGDRVPSNFLQILNDRVLELETAIEADAEATLTAKVIANLISAASI